MTTIFRVNKGLIASVIVIIGVILYTGCSSLNYIKISKEFDLADNIAKAKITGQRSVKDNAWKSTVAKLQIEDKACIFSHPDSSLSYMISLPKDESLVFTSSIGYHPSAKNWGASDGVRMTIEITNGSESKVVFERYVMPKDKLFNLKIPLNDYAGKNIVFRLYSLNDPNKNANGDWAVWFEPKIVVKH